MCFGVISSWVELWLIILVVYKEGYEFGDYFVGWIFFVWIKNKNIIFNDI